MKLSEEEIAEFQILCLDKLGIQLTQQEAQEQGIQLLKVIQLVYHPMTKVDYIDICKKDNEPE